MLVDLLLPSPAREIALKSDRMRNWKVPLGVNREPTDSSFDRRIKLLCYSIFGLVDDAALQ